jgi:hypothetical protein
VALGRLRGVDRGLGGLVELDRHDHAGQDHDVGQEQQGQLGHRVTLVQKT